LTEPFDLRCDGLVPEPPVDCEHRCVPLVVRRRDRRDAYGGRGMDRAELGEPREAASAELAQRARVALSARPLTRSARTCVNGTGRSPWSTAVPGSRSWRG